MQCHFLEAGGTTEPLIPRNAIPEEIVSAAEHRRERLRKALGLIDFALPLSFPKK